MCSIQEETNVPELSRMLSVCSAAYTEYQLLNLEQLVLCRLNFRLLAPTSYYFLHYYMSLRMRQTDAHTDQLTIRYLSHYWRMAWWCSG